MNVTKTCLHISTKPIVIAATATFSFPPSCFFCFCFCWILWTVDMPFLCPVVLLSNTNAADTNRHLSGSYTVRKVKVRDEAGGRGALTEVSCFSEKQRWTLLKKEKKNQASNQKKSNKTENSWLGNYSMWNWGASSTCWMRWTALVCRTVWLLLNITQVPNSPLTSKHICAVLFFLL